MVFADEYRDARAELIAAYQKQNYPEMFLAANNELEVLPGRLPDALFSLKLN